MNEVNDADTNIDIEFKRYLQMMNPYLGHLVDQDIIEICNAWIQKLIACKENEKSLRNKYIFTLCFQLARGILCEPFLKLPPEEDLPPLADEFDSKYSTDAEYMDGNTHEQTKVLYNNKKTLGSETDYLSQDIEYEDDRKNISDRSRDRETQSFTPTSDIAKPSRNSTIICYTCPEISQRNHTPRHFADGHLHTSFARDAETTSPEDQVEYRATNLIMKLREMKKQNMLLHKELEALKVESNTKSINDDNYYLEPIIRTDNDLGVRYHNENGEITNSLKHELAKEKEKTDFLLGKIKGLQRQLKYFNDIKLQDFMDTNAKHELEIIKCKTNIRDECKRIEEDHISELKQEHETKIADLKRDHKSEIEALKKIHEEALNKKDQLLEAQCAEIAKLKAQMVDNGVNLKTILGKILEKPSDNVSSDIHKVKAQELEKRLSKMEKAKAKYTKTYESKLATLQREKHLAECSLQLQLVRQRAQVVQEITDENQAELGGALDTLEAKYRDIVANVQATAIQRRMQDQAALETILQAACGSSNEMFPNHTNTNRSQSPGKNMTARRDHRDASPNHQSYESNMPGATRVQQKRNDASRDAANRSFGDSEPSGYCLDGERLGELIEKLYVPQRDTCGAGHK